MEEVARIQMHDEQDEDDQEIHHSPQKLQIPSLEISVSDDSDTLDTDNDYSPKCKHLKTRDGRNCPILLKYAPKLLIVSVVFALGVAVVYDWRTILKLF